MELRVSADIDETINLCFEDLRSQFRNYWSKHKCDVFGCGRSIIGDGGMKPHRKVSVYLTSFTFSLEYHQLCAAMMSGVREYKNSGVKVITGCTSIPAPDSKVTS